jgi:putative transposase
MGKVDPLVSPHSTYLQMVTGPDERQLHYRKLIDDSISGDELEAIRTYIQRQRALGSSRFQEQIESQHQMRAGLGVPGRPRKERAKVEKVL